MTPNLPPEGEKGYKTSHVGVTPTLGRMVTGTYILKQFKRSGGFKILFNPAFLHWSKNNVDWRGTPPMPPIYIACASLRQNNVLVDISFNGCTKRFHTPVMRWVLMIGGECALPPSPMQVFSALIGKTRKIAVSKYRCPKCGGEGEEWVRGAKRCKRCDHRWDGFF